MTNIFISYARKDSRDLAIRLRDDLLSAGFGVWLDLREIELGGDFTADIERAIDDCDVALVLMSEGSATSQWCRVEQLRALRKGKKVIPLRVQAHAEPPLHLEHLNFIDFSDGASYDAMLRDLLSDIVASQAFRTARAAATPGAGSPFSSGKTSRARASAERRNAPAFRRHIRALRDEAWGLRSWWTYFLFHYVSLADLPEVLQRSELVAPFVIDKRRRSQWDRYVRLYFRPRNPDFFLSEGFIPVAADPASHIAVPVALLFDMEALLLRPDARFSSGDPRTGASTYATPAAFAELPFEMIYHDSWVRTHERDEIVRHREAQVLLPERVALEALQYLWVRSSAEYETLRTVMGPDMWRRWRDKVTTRSDFGLFNHRRPYVRDASLASDHVLLTFNPCHTNAPGEVYVAELIVEHGSARHTWRDDHFDARKALRFDFAPSDGYTVRLTLDGLVAYQDVYSPLPDVL
jgi:hypothetical protein